MRACRCAFHSPHELSAPPLQVQRLHADQRSGGAGCRRHRAERPDGLARIAVHRHAKWGQPEWQQQPVHPLGHARTRTGYPPVSEQRHPSSTRSGPGGGWRWANESDRAGMGCNDPSHSRSRDPPCGAMHAARYLQPTPSPIHSPDPHRSAEALAPLRPRPSLAPSTAAPPHSRGAFLFDLRADPCSAARPLGRSIRLVRVGGEGLRRRSSRRRRHG